MPLNSTARVIRADVFGLHMAEDGWFLKLLQDHSQIQESTHLSIGVLHVSASTAFSWVGVFMYNF